VFFVGGANNEEDFYHLFACLFALVVDSCTLVRRLRRREPARWSEGSIELHKQLDGNEQCRPYYLSVGAIVIDSSVSVKVVADTVLDHIGHLERYRSRKVHKVYLYWVRRARHWWVRRARN
jgi:hypothetical protein